MKLKAGLFGVLTISTLGLLGCGTTGPGPGIQNSFVKYLEREDYTVKLMPSNLEQVGSLVYVKEVDGKKVIDFVDDLENCGVPESVMFGGQTAEQIADNKARLLNARFPQFALEGENEFGFNLAATFKGVGGNANFGKIKRMKATISNAGHETMRREAVNDWLASDDSRPSIKDYCLNALDNQRAAILVDVAYMDSATVEFFRELGGGAEIKMTKAEIAEALDLSASFTAKVTESGEMIIDERIFVAFKASFFNPEGGTLGSGGAEMEDATPVLTDLEFGE